MSSVCGIHESYRADCHACQTKLLSTAIERVESWWWWRYWTDADRTDLTELLRLAKLGERVEQCQHIELNDGPPDYTHAEPFANGRRCGHNDLLAWLKRERT